MRIRRQVNSSAWFSLLCGEIPASRGAIPASSAGFPNCKDFRHSRRREVCARDHTWRDCAARVWVVLPSGFGTCEMMRQVAPAKGMCSAGRSGSWAEIRGLSRDKPGPSPHSAGVKPATLSADRAEGDPADHQDFVRPCDGPHSRPPSIVRRKLFSGSNSRNRFRLSQQTSWQHQIPTARGFRHTPYKNRATVWRRAHLPLD
jgi:hypothetical protein